MTTIEFPDHSYIQVQKTSEGKISIVISAKDYTNANKRIVNCVEITEAQFADLVKLDVPEEKQISKEQQESNSP